MITHKTDGNEDKEKSPHNVDSSLCLLSGFNTF